MTEVELAKIKDAADARQKRYILGCYLILALALLGFVGMGLRPTAPPPCLEGSKVITLHDTMQFSCGQGAKLHHEKMDDFKVYVECICK